MDLKKMRESAGLSQEEAAKRLNKGRSTLYRLETGITKRRDYDLIERAKLLYAAVKKSSPRRKAS